MNELIIGRLIKKLRKEKNITMIKFAKQIGISQSSLSRIESGSQELSLNLLSKICEEFNMTKSNFFRLLDESNKLHELEYDANSFEAEKLEDQLEDKLHKMISSLSIEQKKALYVLLLPFIEE